MTEEPILEVPGYVREEPQVPPPPNGGSVIDSVPFSVPLSAREEPQEEPAPVHATGLIDSVPAVSSSVWSDTPPAPARTPLDAPPFTTLEAAITVQVPLADVTPPSPPPTPAAPAAASAAAVAASPPPTQGVQVVAPSVPENNPFSEWALDDDVEVTRRVVRSTPTVRLTWDDGTVTAVTSPTLLGRNPASASTDVAVAIADTTLSLSKTHARVTAIPPAIEDLDSTNGVEIERNGVRVPVPRRQPVSLAAGDTLVFGNRRASVEVVS